MQNNFDEKFNISLLPLKEQEASQLNAIELAYLGDTVYDLYVRSFLVKNDLGVISAIHQKAADIVNARAQNKSFKQVFEILTEQEKEVFTRGRNAKSSVPKNMTVNDYRHATGFETLIGYLYITGKKSRLDELFKIILSDFFKE
ncbi:MAG: ribonuclease III domain-containing protein [Eubacteriales bacterium]